MCMQDLAIGINLQTKVFPADSTTSATPSFRGDESLFAFAVAIAGETAGIKVTFSLNGRDVPFYFAPSGATPFFYLFRRIDFGELFNGTITASNDDSADMMIVSQWLRPDLYKAVTEMFPNG